MEKDAELGEAIDRHLLNRYGLKKKKQKGFILVEVIISLILVFAILMVFISCHSEAKKSHQEQMTQPKLIVCFDNNGIQTYRDTGTNINQHDYPYTAWTDGDGHRQIKANCVVNP